MPPETADQPRKKPRSAAQIANDKDPARIAAAKKGAGRPKGATNKLIIANIEKAAAAGILPLDVILSEMRIFHRDLVAERAKLRPHAARLRRLSAQARECAKEAAPYLHPKLASIQHSGNVQLTHEQALKQLAGEQP